MVLSTMAAGTSLREKLPSGTGWKQQRRNVLSRNLLKESVPAGMPWNGVSHEPE
jgi:hypothetical protein